MVACRHSLINTIFSIIIAVIIIIALNYYTKPKKANYEHFLNLNVLYYHIVDNWKTYENYIPEELIETNIANVINRSISKNGIRFGLNIIKENIKIYYNDYNDYNDYKKSIFIVNGRILFYYSKTIQNT